VAVVATYSAFLGIVWAQPWWAGRLFVVLLLVAYAQMMDLQVKDSLSVVARRTFVGVIVLAYGWMMWKPFSTLTRGALDLCTFGWIVGFSALSYLKLVEPVWTRGWTKRWLEKPRRLVSLNDFSLHFYGEPFAQLLEEQQAEVCRLERSNPLGTWVRRVDSRFPTVQDERMRHEDDRVRAQAQRLMAWILLGSAGTWSLADVLISRPVSHALLTTWMWTMAALGFTLRQAIVLWTEDDPIAVNGELELVEREA
jgi:hypothetical protein